jgi:molybdate transport system regulatory protein
MVKIPSDQKFLLDGRIWITFGYDSFAGQGKIELLEKIKEVGSLRKAALDMKMSYRQAWLNINKMNKLTRQPLVILKHGGKDGGIAQITDFGEKILFVYKNLKISFSNFLAEQKEVLNLLLNEPNI